MLQPKTKWKVNDYGTWDLFKPKLTNLFTIYTKIRSMQSTNLYQINKRVVTLFTILIKNGSNIK